MSFKKIRTGVFEINSSYTHSLVVNSTSPLKPYKPGRAVYNFITDSLSIIGEVSKDMQYNGEMYCSEKNWLDFFTYVIVQFSRLGKYEAADELLEFYKDFTGYPMNLICELEIDGEDTILEYVKDEYITVKFMVHYFKENFKRSVIRTFRLVTNKEIEEINMTNWNFFNKCDSLYDIYYSDETKSKYKFLVYPDKEYYPVSSYLFNRGCCNEIEFFFYDDIPDRTIGKIVADYMRYGICDLGIEDDSMMEYYGGYSDWLKICRNGNGNVSLFSDGTKIITSEDDEFIPEYPVSVDFKITDMCSNGCPFCYENSLPDGCDGSEQLIRLIEELPETTEAAIGGGNPIESRLLETILNMEKKCSVSFTINQNDIEKIYDFENRKFRKDCYRKAAAIGISVTNVTAKFCKRIEKISYLNGVQIVWHIIAGVLTYEKLKRFLKAVPKSRVLILGYKNNGRGVDYLRKNSSVTQNQKDFIDNIDEIRENTFSLSFDNLAVEQLGLSDKIPEDDWKLHYLGAEGRYSMFIDMVSGEFTLSSNNKHRWKIEEGMTVKEMFKTVREEASCQSES